MNDSVSVRLGVLLGDGLSTSSAMLEGVASVFGALGGRPTQALYESMCVDPRAPRVIARPWALRKSTTSDPATDARLMEDRRQQSIRAGTCGWQGGSAAGPRVRGGMLARNVARFIETHGPHAHLPPKPSSPTAIASTAAQGVRYNDRRVAAGEPRLSPFAAKTAAGIERGE